jgi:hypothetical protein
MHSSGVGAPDRRAHHSLGDFGESNVVEDLSSITPRSARKFNVADSQHIEGVEGDSRCKRPAVQPGSEHMEVSPAVVFGDELAVEHNVSIETSERFQLRQRS